MIETAPRKVQNLLYLGNIGQIWCGTRDGFISVYSMGAPVCEFIQQT